MRTTTSAQDTALAATDTRRDLVRIKIEDASATLQPYTIIGGAELDWVRSWRVQRNADHSAGSFSITLARDVVLARWAADATASTDTLDSPGHGLANGDTVYLETATAGGSLPSGLAVETLYWIIGVSGDSLQLSASEGGSAVDITSDGALTLIEVVNIAPTKASSNKIAAGREVVIEVATVAGSTAVEDVASSEWQEILRGEVDNNDWPETLTINGLDGMGPIMRAWVETPTTYGAGGVAMETVMQNIINDLPGVTDTLYVPTSPSFTVVEFQQRIQAVVQALQANANLVGWVLHDRWDDGTSAFRRTFREPDRTKTTPDFTIGAGDYHSVSAISEGRDRVRNVVIGEWEPGSFVSVTDSASITKYGRRPLFLDFTANPQITSAALATTVITAAANDLAEPLATMAVDMPLYWPVQLDDLVTFEGDFQHLAADTDLAVSGFEHFGEAGEPPTRRTRLFLREQPTGGTLRWHEFARPTKGAQETRDRIPTLAFPGVTIESISRDAATGNVLISVLGNEKTADVRLTWTIGDGTSAPADPTSGDTALGARSGTLDTAATADPGQIVRVKARGEDSGGTLAPVEFIAIARHEVAGVPDGSVDNDSFAASLKIAVDKVVSQAAGFSTDINLRAHSSLEDRLAWDTGTLWFADGTSEAITGNSSYAVNSSDATTGTWYIYWDGAQITDTQTFTTAIASSESNILLATVDRASGGDPWTVIPAVGVLGVVGAPIQTEHLRAAAITTDKLAANSVIATKIDVVSLDAIAADIGEITAGILKGPTATFDLDTASGTDKILDTPGVTVFHSGKTLMNLGVGLTFLQGVSDEIAVETGTRTNHSIRFFDNDNAQSLFEVSEDSAYFDFMATEVLSFADAGSTGATEQDWIEVTVGGVTGYIRVFAAK